MVLAPSRAILATIIVASAVILSASLISSASLAAPPAVTTDFASSASILAESCGKDIEANCLGVSLDVTRLKECLSRNQDVVSQQCRADYFRTFDAIQKRISARNAVSKACTREKQKICAEEQGRAGPTISCLIKAPAKSLGWACNQAIGVAGYR
jgi:hypothetical protein